MKIRPLVLCGSILCFAVACNQEQAYPPAEVSVGSDNSSGKASAVVTVTDANFKSEVLDSELPVLVDFWAPWCGPCVQQGPIVDALADEMQGVVKVGKANVDEATGLAQEYQVSAIPTLIVFKGGKPVEQLIGMHNREQLVDALKKVTDQ